MSFSLSEYTKIDVGLQCSPDPLASFKGVASRHEGNGGKDYGRREERGKAGMGKGGERGKLGEIMP